MHETIFHANIIRMSGMRNSGRGSRAFYLGAAVFLLAALVRGLYLYESSDNPTFSAPIVDSRTYDQMARWVAKGEGVTDKFFWQPFFYPFFLSLLYRVSNFSILWAKVVQIILGAVTCALVYRLSEKLFGRTTGIWAGVITAVYMPLVFFEAELLATGWAAFWSVAIVWALIEAGEEPNVWRSFIFGLCGALSIVTRPVFLPFFAAGVVWLMVRWIVRRLNVRDLGAGILSLAIGFSGVLLGMGILSYRVTGRAIILPLSGGINLYIGNNPNYKETITIRPGVQWEKLRQLPGEHGFTDRYARERFFADKTIQYVRNEPLSFLKGLARKSTQFFNSRETPRNLDIYLFREWSSLLRVGVWKVRGFGFPFGLLLPLAVIGAVYRRRMVPGPIWVFLVSYPASVILVFVTSRYRMPIIPVMSILAAAGCVTIWKILQARQWGQFAAVGATIVGIGLASSVAGPFYEEQFNYEPELYGGVAASLSRQGKVDEAIETYSKAISLKADFIEAHVHLALLLLKQERYQEAVGHWNIALEIEPGDVRLHRDLGLTLFKLGRVEDAIEEYHKAIRIDPNKASIHDNLGTAFQKLNRLSEALQHYSKATELEPNNAVYHSHIGDVLDEQGQHDRAIEQYELSLRLRPHNPGVLNNLAGALTSLGEFEQAVGKYRAALQIAPDNPSIYFNLGLCLQKQGRIIESAAAYRQALFVDPKHNGALQALKKLEESSPR